MPWNPFGKKPGDLVSLFREAGARVRVPVKEIQGNRAVIIVRGEPTQVSLANVLPRLQSASPREQREILDHFLRALAEAPGGAATPQLAQIRERLMPRVGLPFHPDVEQLPSRPFLPLKPDRTHAGQDPSETVTEPGMPALFVHLVVDEPRSVWFVRQQHLKDWRVSFDDLHSTAIENLRRRSSPDRWESLRQAPGLAVYDTGDSYDASRVLILRDLIRPFPAMGTVVSIPVRDSLLCVRFDRAEALKAMKTMIGFSQDLFRREGYKITDQPLWFDGEAWEHLPSRASPDGLKVFPSKRFTEALLRLDGSRATTAK